MKVDVNHSILGQYFIGHFDGARFVSDAFSDRGFRLDYGKDFYAAQSWSDNPTGRRIWVGWMNNWDYANAIPTSPWRGMFSIPRELRLRQYPEGLRLVQQPIPELRSLRRALYHAAEGDLATVNAQLAASKMGIAQEIEAEFALGAAREFGIKIRAGGAEETVIGYDAQTQTMFVDRRRAGNNAFSPKFAGLHRAPLTPKQGKIKFHIFIDSCAVEVFGNDGWVVITDLIFPDPQSAGVEFYARDGEAQLNSLDVWNLNFESEHS